LTEDEAKRLEQFADPEDPRPDWRNVPGELVKGLGKSAARAAVGAGQLVHQIPGVSRAVNALYGLAGVPDMDSAAMMAQAGEAPELTPQTPSERAGKVIGDVAQFALSPTGKVKAAAQLPRLARGAVEMARQGTAAGLVSGIQGNDPAVGAALGAAAPVVAAGAKAAVRGVGGMAEPLVRSGIKPLWSDMSKQAGASTLGQDRLATRLARFIIDHGITDAKKAERIILDAEAEIQSMVGAQVTDAPQRALRYLDALKNSAARQGLPEQDVRIIAQAARELLRNRHGYTAVKTFYPSGRVAVTRAPRRDMTAAESLDAARRSSQWGNRKAWGEQKGAATEASKAVERADRDAVKQAVPQSRPVFQRQGQAIQSKKVFNRGEFRQANRDTLGMPTIFAGAQEVTHGKAPFVAMAAEFLRRNQVKMGVWADRLASALQRNDVETIAFILQRFGVGLGAQTPPPGAEYEDE
jgi:hypothetical protein